MAEAQLFGLQDEITCPVCLDTLSDPISILCGHSFCLKCLTDYWDLSQLCRCPQCRRTFTTRPELHRNTVLNELVRKIKKPRLSPHSSQNYIGPGDVECDTCTGNKSRAMKSCLTCMASFCQTHLQPHFEIAAWKDHKLTDPVRNLKEKLCVKHHKSLDLFCKTDETCICVMCVVRGHNGHTMVELENERKEKQKQLGAIRIEITRRLEEREKTLQETMRAMEQIMISVEEEVEEQKKNFTHLICCIEETWRKLMERIREREKTEKEKAEGVTEQIEKEIEELKGTEAELKELLETNNNFRFLEIFSSCCILSADGDTLSFTVTADFTSEELRKELACLKKRLEKISQWEIMRWTSGREAPIFAIQPPEPRSREEFLQYLCSLTLDISTANRELRLSEEDKKVTCKRTKANYPDHPDRFDYCPQVLCSEALTGTRCYWEVKFTGHWVRIGVTYKGLCRKGLGSEYSLGNNDNSWSLFCSHSQCFVCHNRQRTIISAPYSPRIGVYLDWPAGSLSFYSVSHTMTLLHRFNTSFTEPLYPGFWVGPDCSVTLCPLTPCDY